MNLVDVHAHLDYPPLNENTEQVIQKAIASGVKVIISNGTSPKSNRQVLALAKRYSLVKPALGFYPTHVTECSLEEFDAELAFIREARPIALGEVGLEYKFAKEDGVLFSDLPASEAQELQRRQEEAFIKFIQLSNELDIPLIVHSRKAEERCIELLELHGAKKVVMHCFMGKKKLIPRIIKNGWTFSISYLVMKLEQVQYIVQVTPLRQLLTETDAPFLGPQPGVTNDSATIVLVVEKMAEIKGLTTEELTQQLFMNYQQLFL
jgi:TatD DNase family protein